MPKKEKQELPVAPLIMFEVGKGALAYAPSICVGGF